jgi:hypothetical protein
MAANLKRRNILFLAQTFIFGLNYKTLLYKFSKKINQFIIRYRYFLIERNISCIFERRKTNAKQVKEV